MWRRWPPAKRLEFEITEGLLIDDTEEVFGKLNWLLSLVSGSSWDDFDTSYPSFSYFARFVVHKIKIDRPLVRNMTRDLAMRVIVNTIIALGKFLDVIVTGKGVQPRCCASSVAHRCRVSFTASPVRQTPQARAARGSSR